MILNAFLGERRTKKLIYILLEKEDMFNIEVIKNEEGNTLTFFDREEAEEYAEAMCFDAQIVEIDEC